MTSTRPRILSSALFILKSFINPHNLEFLPASISRLAGRLYFSNFLKMKTKSLIEKQVQRKNNSKLVKTIIASKKDKNWFKIAEILSRPRRKRMDINLGEINKKTKEGEIMVVPGKVLSQGNVKKKVKVVALSFSAKAKEKLLKSNCKISYIEEEIKKNPEAKGVKILR